MVLQIPSLNFRKLQATEAFITSFFQLRLQGVSICVNSPAFSECHPHSRQLTRKNNVVQYHLHSF